MSDGYDGNDEDDDDTMETFPLPEITRLYRIKYLIYGRNKLLLLEMSSIMIAKDVADVIDAVRKKLLGVELNGTTADGESYFETVDEIDIIYCDLVAPIHGMTELGYSYLKKAYESSHHFKMTTDNVKIEQDDVDEEEENDDNENDDNENEDGDQ